MQSRADAKPVFIDNGISPYQAYSMTVGVNRCIFWLPGSPYGNFQLKLLRIEQLTYVANLRLRESFESWKNMFPANNGFGDTFCGVQHQLATEQAIYLIRRAADELISLIWCLFYWETTGDYPPEIKIDSIGKLLRRMDKDTHFNLTPLFGRHHSMLKALNEISNAFKHSFTHSDGMNIQGQDEPCVHALALGLRDNKLSSPPMFHLISLAKLVQEFNVFHNASLNWLEDFSKKYKPADHL